MERPTRLFALKKTALTCLGYRGSPASYWPGPRVPLRAAGRQTVQPGLACRSTQGEGRPEDRATTARSGQPPTFELLDEPVENWISQHKPSNFAGMPLFLQ